MRRFLVAAVAACLLLQIGCARQAKLRERVLGFVSRTEALTKTFDYQEEIGAESIRVTGRIGDAFRYQETVKMGGVDVLEQIVDDDAVAVRVLNPEKIPTLAGGSLIAGASPILSDTLRSGEWVIDPSGAPPIQKKQVDPDAYVPSNPLRDPIDIFTYLRTSIATAADIREWREDDITPAYRPKEDRFPPADLNAGVRRFDLVRPPLPNLLRPAAGGAGGGTSQVDPRTYHFRKMAIYVRGDRIVRVLEEIDVDGHAEVQEAIERRRTRVIELVKNIKAGATREKIKIRKMSITFSEFGEDFEIRKPENGLLASLKALFGPDAPRESGNIFGFGEFRPEEMPASEDVTPEISPTPEGS